MILERGRLAYRRTLAPHEPLPHMDPETLLSFTEPKVGVPFGLALCAGLALACGGALLRPWPPRARRAVPFAVALAICLGAAGLLLRTRELQIDVARQQVRERSVLLGLARTQTWPFSAVQAVVAERTAGAAERGPQDRTGAPPAPEFHVHLRIGQDTIEVSRQPDAFAAEAGARRIALATGWPALRRGYRMEATLPAGALGRFRLPDGREGTQLDLQDVRRVVPAPGQESALAAP